MKGYLNYLLNNFKNGNYTTGILIIATVLIYIVVVTIGLINSNPLLYLSAILYLLVGSGICISWNNYWHEKNKSK